MQHMVSLDNFHAPLDLLLHLIDKAEIDIKDIFVSEITSQYLEYMADIDELDIDSASEFLSMAATLVYIKSRTMLPRQPKDNSDEIDPEQALIIQLREYKAFKEAGERLEKLMDDSSGVYSKLPEEFLLPPQDISFFDASVEGLFIAFDLLMQRIPEEKKQATVHQINKDKYTIRNQLKKIRALLLENSRLAFEDFFEVSSTKTEKIVTFMALLDMLMRHEIHIGQSTPYGSIIIYAKELNSEDDDIEYMDEQ